MKTNPFLTTFFCAMTLSCLAFSQSHESKVRAASRVSSPGMEGGWFPFVNLGYGHLDQNGNSDVDGDGLTAQFLGTFYYPSSSWLSEAGLGIHKQYFKDTDTQPIVGVLSVSGRYRLPYRWSVGPTADLFFGNRDSFGASNNYMAMLGVSGFKEFVIDNNQLFRLGAKYTGEVEGGQTGNYIGLVFAWGMGSSDSSMSTVSNQ